MNLRLLSVMVEIEPFALFQGLIKFHNGGFPAPLGSLRPSMVPFIDMTAFLIWTTSPQTTKDHQGRILH